MESKCTLVYGQMNEPPGARARVALTGLTVAEYFRDEEGQDVLLFVDNIFRFTQVDRGAAGGREGRGRRRRRVTQADGWETEGLCCRECPLFFAAWNRPGWGLEWGCLRGWKARTTAVNLGVFVAHTCMLGAGSCDAVAQSES